MGGGRGFDRLKVGNFSDEKRGKPKWRCAERKILLGLNKRNVRRLKKNPGAVGVKEEGQKKKNWGESRG